MKNITSISCDNCNINLNPDDMRMLDEDWWLCENCFEENI